MNNLAVHMQSRRDIEDLQLNDINNCLSCLNSDNDCLYVFLKDSLYEIPPDVTKDINGLSIRNYIENDRAGAIEYCSVLEKVVLALDSGSILLIDIQNHTVMSCDYFFDGGISCIKFSPDHEILVIVSKLNVMHLLFTQSHLTAEDGDMLPIHTESLDNTEFGENQFITVGWGKKETQFHGSEGKAAAKAVQTAIQPSSTDNGSTSISWRADGAFFAISFMQGESPLRKFKVFNREGILQSTSESVNGLDHNLSWKPSGFLIATSQELPNKRVVALFEKNGLKHRDFTVDNTKSKIKIMNMCWSSDSEVLSILVNDEETGIASVQLWTEKNYHWYLKQTLHFAKENPVLYMNWSSVPKSGKTLFILTPKEQIICSYRWTINHSRGKDIIDKSAVGVIDGSNVLLTNFRDNVVPPPMSQYSFNIGEQTNEIVFAPSESRVHNPNSFFCVLDRFRFAFYDFVENQYVPKKILTINWKNNISEESYSSQFMNHFLWFNDDTILCSALTRNRGTSSNKEMEYHNCVVLVLKIDLDNENIFVEEEITISGFVEHIVKSATNANNVYIFDSGNEVSKYSLIDNILTPGYLSMNETFEQVEVISVNQKDFIISRTSKHRLYINEKNIVSNVTSFFVHSNFLLLTTLQHTLLCFPLTEEGLHQLMTSDLTVKPWENENKNENTATNYLNLRRIERGATLVVSVPKDSRTILQMPRGNLECIHPRTLSLYTIGQMIDDLNYNKAFILMYQQSINLNLLYDHNPSLFLNNIDKFIDDSPNTNANYLTNFLSKLNNEDVTRTIYASCYPDRKSNPEIKSEVDKKVETVCTLMRAKLEERSDQEGDRLKAILLCLVRGDKILGIENALSKFKSIQQEKPGSEAEALRFLLNQVDVNDLYNTALGMYDLDLTMHLAQWSRKDPKEYVPFLNNLKNMQQERMRFEIDKHLYKYESALAHLAKLPDKFDECIEFIGRYLLYRAGMKLFSGNSEEYKQIANIYGKHLLQNTKYEEAGVMFSKAGNYEGAMNAYRLAGKWQECIVMAHRTSLSPADKNVVYKTLITRLKSEKKFQEAATIASKYMNNLEESVLLLCEGKLWLDAWREAILIGREEIIESHVKPGVLEYAQHLLLQVQSNRENFEKYKCRLEVISSPQYQKAKREQYALPYECDITTEDGINDMMSDTTSNYGSTTSYGSQSSRSSGRSCRSSKNRRKQQRKLLNLKEGSLFEDLALMRALHSIITTTYSQKVEVHNVMKMLMQFNEDEITEQLFREFDGLLYLIVVSESKIWPPDNQAEDNSLQKRPFLCGSIPPGLIESHILYPPKKESSSWTLDIFKRKY